MTSPPATALPPLLEVTNLHIRFGQHTAVDGISFHIAPGETLGLVGESGSGKSATSLALLRLLPLTATLTGAIRLAGPSASGTPPERSPGAHDLLTLPEPAMRRLRGRDLSMIFQEPMTALNPVMPIGRQIAEALTTHHPGLSRAEVRARVLGSLHEVALPDPASRLLHYPHQFSGGQRQRILIAMAILNRPRLLIADEPTTALDVTVQAQILDLLRTLQRTHGLSMLFISHDLAVVSQIATRVAVMQHGRIVETAPTATLFRNPRHPYTQRLLRSAPTMQTDRTQPLATAR